MSNSRRTKGSGSIRQKKNGTWEARFTTGKDVFGKQVQKSVSGKTADEARRKMIAALKDVDEGTYTDPNKTKLSVWLDRWLMFYVKNTVKPLTYDSYEQSCRLYLKPYLGEIRLKDLTTDMIQAMYVELLERLSPKTVRNIHGVLHKALKKAVNLGTLKINPADLCELPKVKKKKLNTLTIDDSIGDFLEAIKGTKYEEIMYITLFTGMRAGEILGLTWDCVDFKENTILVEKQLKKTSHNAHAEYCLDSTKNDKARTIVCAPSVMLMFARQKSKQEKWQGKAGSAWSNKWNLVFTNELGEHLCHFSVYKDFKKIVTEIGCPELRFHDLRHSYATLCLEAGDDLKTVQENLGHATASFTLDVYGHLTKKMQNLSAQRVQQQINKVS